MDVCNRSAALAAALLLQGCAWLSPPPPPPPPPRVAEVEAPQGPDPEVYRRAEAERAKALESEIERLRVDLRDAEAALVTVESGLRGAQTRAEAVSSLAEARIEVDRAAKRVPWRGDAVTEARSKLEEADRQLTENRIGAAIFFASRASRMAAGVLAEASRAEKGPGTRWVKSARANLRAEPSKDASVVAVLAAGIPVFYEQTVGEWLLVRTSAGQVGWVNASVVKDR